MREIRAYNCDFCKKYSKSKAYMRHHEKHCYSNPAMKACYACANFYQEIHKAGSIVHTRPACTAGKKLSFKSEDAPLGYVARLKYNCELWQEKEDEPDE